jgi:pimeloyl-ACP methyl ester carboxylesterase
MYLLRTILLALTMVPLAAAQQKISFPTEDGGRVCADLYGQGTRAVVLARGGSFNKESWRVQANALVFEGFRVLAIDFRRFGCSIGPGAS